MILLEEKDKKLRLKLKEHLISLSSVRDLILSKSINLTSSHELIKPFRGTVLKLVFKSNDNIKTKMIALMAIFRIPAVLFRLVYFKVCKIE